MKRPADDEINRVMAESIGWHERHGTWRHESKPGEGRFAVPDYCHDRNALPEVWAAVGGKWSQFCYNLRHPLLLTDASAWRMIRAEPRTQVVAALKALGKWPTDWTETP